MRHLFSLLVLLSTLLSCSSRLESPCVTGGRSVISWRGDPSFSEAERADINQAMVEWQIFTGGRVNHTVVFDAHGLTEIPIIVRVESWMPIVVRQEERQARRFNVEKFELAGWQKDDPMRIFLVADRVRPPFFRWVAAHELGHAAGLQWPGCDLSDAKADCHHSPDPKALMHGALDTNRQGFTDADRAFCRASCLCD